MDKAYFQVIKGEQAGSIIELELGKSYTVATDFSADIYLQLSKDTNFSFVLSETHSISFSSLPEDLTLTHVDGDTLSNPADQDKEYQLPIQFITDGATIQISLNQEVIGAVKKEHTIFEDDNIEDDDDSVGNDFAKNVKDAADKAPPPTAIDKMSQLLYHASIKTKFYWNKLYEILGYWLYLIVSVIITLIVVSGVFVHQMNVEAEYVRQVSEANAIYQKMQKVLISLPGQYNNIRIHRRQNTFVVQGLLENQELQTHLVQLLKPITPKIVYHTLVFDAIKPSIIRILAQNNITNPSVTYADSGGYSVEIGGVTDDVNNVDNAEIVIHNQFAHLGQINVSKVFFTKKIDKFITTKVPDGILDQLSIEKHYSTGVIKVRGLLEKEKISYLNNLVNQFNDIHKGVVKIILRVQDILLGMPFAIRTVYTGSPSWIITDDGVKLYVGGMYKGIRVVAISPDKVTFKGQFEFSLSMNEIADLGQQHSSYNTTPKKVRQYNTTSSGQGGVCNDRDCILAQEQVKESEAIAKEAKQLKQLKKLTTHSDQQIANDLKDTIDNLSKDIEAKTKEYNANYNKGK